MTWKSWIPFYGDQTVRARVRQLEEEAGTLPFFFALFAAEGVKLLVPPAPEVFLTLAVAAAVLYVYGKHLVEAKDAAKEKAEEAVDSN